jgi:hypothetical protein
LDSSPGYGAVSAFPTPPLIWIPGDPTRRWRGGVVVVSSCERCGHGPAMPRHNSPRATAWSSADPQARCPGSCPGLGAAALHGSGRRRAERSIISLAAVAYGSNQIRCKGSILGLVRTQMRSKVVPPEGLEPLTRDLGISVRPSIWCYPVPFCSSE